MDRCEDPETETPFFPLIRCIRLRFFEKYGKIVAEQFENLTLQWYIIDAFDMGLYRFRLDVLNVDCVPRMTVGLVNHRLKK